MKYYLIVGEASGDLHASNLMRALLAEDPKAEFRFFGGDLMRNVGGTCVRHYKSLAYMGFVPVLLHLRTILRNMDFCKSDVEAWNPDVLILVDYPGFNLKIAQYIKLHTQIPVFYYISPKIWAWKEYRIKNIKRDVDGMFSILPFEVEFYRKHQYPIHYVGNPCVDAVAAFRKGYGETFDEFVLSHGWGKKPIIALLAGSRRQEIKDNLQLMIRASRSFPQYIDADTEIVFGETYRLLAHATAALVTSGTATLETALFRVPQVVCYYTAAGKLVSLLRRVVLKVPFVSLVNLIAGKEVVTELVAGDMRVGTIVRGLSLILPGGKERGRMLDDYNRLIQVLGEAGASERAATQMIEALKAYKKKLYA